MVFTDKELKKRKNKRNKIYRDTHKEKVKESKAREYQKHKERYKKYHAKNRKKNREFLLQQNRVYSARPENKTRAREQKH